MTRLDFAKRICQGGFPEAITREGKRRRSWFHNYATTVVERVVSEIADIERLHQMPKLLRLCTARTANELNVAAVANDLGAPARTVSGYLSHLQTVFMIDMIPAWSRVLGANEQSLLGLDSPIGQLLEPFVVGELRKQLQWAETMASMYHFRNRDGAEVDVVLEAADGKVAGIEVKAASTGADRDFRGLRLLQTRLGKSFVGGVVLYAGKQTVPFGKQLAAVPSLHFGTLQPTHKQWEEGSAVDSKV